MKTVEVSQSALESLQKMVEQLQGEREELLSAMEVIIASRDENCFKPEEFVKNEIGEYWSPHSSMVESSAINAGRLLVAKCTAKPDVLA